MTEHVTDLTELQINDVRPVSRSEPMSEPVKARWLAALRGGKYRQTQRFLNVTDSGHCCLGVLCDLAVADGIGAWVRVLEKHAESDVLGWKENTQTFAEFRTLPRVVGALAGLSDEVGSLFLHGVQEHDGHPGDYESVALTGLNDDGLTFSQIADLIEFWL